MPTPYTWLNGAITPWDQSVIHVNTDCVLRGSNVFEGIRAYRTDDGDDLLLFRLDKHLDRLFGTSMRVLRMTLPYSKSDLSAAIVELLRANEIREDTHVRVVVYFGEGPETAFAPEEIITGCFILTLPRPQQSTLKDGMRCGVSQWRRISDTAMPPRVKAGANYLNSRLSTIDARLKGFHLPILLNEAGRVAEGPGQCIFLVRNGVLLTPRVTDSILEGVTRETVIELAREFGIPYEDRSVDASELYIADEIFFAGTAAEVQPVVEIDHYQVGAGTIGPITRRLQDGYMDLVRGRRGRERGWTTSVYAGATASRV